MLLYGQFMLDTSEPAFPIPISIQSMAASATLTREHSCDSLQCSDNHDSLQLMVNAVTIPLTCQVNPLQLFMMDAIWFVCSQFTVLVLYAILLCDWAANRKADCFIMAAVPYAGEHPGWRRSMPGHSRGIGNSSDPDRFISNL